MALKYIWVNPEKSSPRVIWGRDFSWDHLENTELMEALDMRFTLYDVEDNLTHCLFFDIDDIKDVDREEVARLASSVVKGFHYAVDTGGGVHLYYVLNEPITVKEIKERKKHYDELCDEMQEKIGVLGKVDKNVFSAKKLGRVVGSFNTKSLGDQRLLYVDRSEKFSAFGMDAIELSDEEFDASNVEEHVIVDAVDAHCGVVKDFRERAHELSSSYDLWFRVGHIFKGLGKEVEFLGLTSPERKEKSGDKLRGETLYPYGCGKIEEAYADKGELRIPCYGCVHRGGPGPLWVSGALPCKSRKSGFRKIRVVEKEGVKKYEDGGLHHDDLVNHYINTRSKDLIQIKESGDFWVYDGFKWKWLCDREMKRGDKNFRKDYHNLNIKGSNYGDNLKLDNIFKSHTGFVSMSEEDFDKRNLIIFKNKALDVDFQKKRVSEVELSATLYNRNHLPFEYDPKARAPVFEKYLEFICDGDDTKEEILKIVMGLTVASVSPVVYGKFFWLFGNSGSGKSTFASLLELLVGKENVAIINKKSFEGGIHGFPDLRGKLVLSGKDFKLDSWGKYKVHELMEKLCEACGEHTMGQKLPHGSPHSVSQVCTSIITSNELPPLLGTIMGMIRRVVPIEFYKVPEEVDGNLMVKFGKELSGIYNHAIEGVKLFMKNGFSNYNADWYIEEAMEGDADPIRSFVDEYYEISKTNWGVKYNMDRISVPEIYEDWFRFRELPFDGTKQDKISFMRQFRKIFADKYKVSLPFISYRSNDTRYVVGIKRRGVYGGQDENA